VPTAVTVTSYGAPTAARREPAPITAVSGPHGFYPWEITPLSGGSRRVALFVANLARGLALWRTNGSARGTRLVKVVSFRGGGAQYLTRVGLAGKPVLLMQADDGIHGPELWRSDGSSGGTFPLGDK
jgi:ELWxxDGT repeat protein